MKKDMKNISNYQVPSYSLDISQYTSESIHWRWPAINCEVSKITLSGVTNAYKPPEEWFPILCKPHVIHSKRGADFTIFNHSSLFCVLGELWMSHMEDNIARFIQVK